MVVQIVATDVVLLLVLLAFGAGLRPNLHFRQLRKIAAFSGRAFAAGLLVNSVSRNIDNLLVGRFQGPEALAFYALAYRLLLLPVQLASTTVGARAVPGVRSARRMMWPRCAPRWHVPPALSPRCRCPAWRWWLRRRRSWWR